MHKIPFRETVQRNSAGAANEDVSFGPVRDGRRYHVDHCAVRDKTSTPTGAVTMLITGHGTDYAWDEVPAPGAGRLYPFLDDIYLFPGESLTARFAGTTLNDALELHLEGEWWNPDEVDVYVETVTPAAPPAP